MDRAETQLPSFSRSIHSRCLRSFCFECDASRRSYVRPDGVSGSEISRFKPSDEGHVSDGRSKRYLSLKKSNPQGTQKCSEYMMQVSALHSLRGSLRGAPRSRGRTSGQGCSAELPRKQHLHLLPHFTRFTPKSTPTRSKTRHLFTNLKFYPKLTISLYNNASNQF